MMPPVQKDAALIIVGHGSTLNPDSSAPTHRCADEIRSRNLFREVVCAFWKEEPSMREVFYMVDSPLIYIVPNFISEGYFTREVLPRELELDGPVTRRDGRIIHYCQPVGIHRSMTQLLLHRAGEVAPGVPRDQVSLVIAGHGTSLNEQSRKAIEAQVAFIREGGHGFAEVRDAYMEEAPFVARWDEITLAPNVVVVPFFIADGLHSYQDIPVLLGIDPEPASAASQSGVFRHNPHTLRGRNLFYSSAIGTDPLMADVIVDQVRDRLAGSRDPATSPIPPSQAVPAKPSLDRTPFTIGQVLATPEADGGWTLHHAADAPDAARLPETTSPTEARTIALWDDAGNFRPLKTAPNLRRGWRLRLASEADLRLALDFLYPGALALWRHLGERSLRPVPLRETLARQTGRYRFANTISDDEARHMVACACDAKTKCLRRITWPLDAGQSPLPLPADKRPTSSPTPGHIPLLCVEACTHLVSAAREIARSHEKTRD